MKIRTSKCFFAAFILSATCLINSAASDTQEDVYNRLVGNFTLEQPAYEDRLPLGKAAALALVNQTNSPLQILYRNNEQIYGADLAASSDPSVDKGGTLSPESVLRIDSMEGLSPIIGMRPKSMTTGYRLMPTIFSSALTSAFYGDAYTAYDLKSLVDTDQVQVPALLAFKRNGLISNQFNLESINLQASPAAYEATRNFIYDNRTNLRIRNDSLNPMEITYRAYPGRERTISLAQGETAALADINALNDSRIRIKTGTVMLPSGAAEYIYGGEQVYDLPYLTIKSASGESALYQATLQDGQNYDIVIPALGSMYVEPVDRLK